MPRTRDLALVLAGALLLASCTAHLEPKVQAVAPGNCAERAPGGRAPVPLASYAAPGDRLTQAVLDGIPRPRPGQFDTPERLLGFLFETVASRDLAGSLAAFPVIEHAERVTLKDYVEYTYVFSPDTYPLDDDRYGRLNHALVSYLGLYYGVALAILSDGAQPSGASPGNPSAALQVFDGPRLTSMKVISMTELVPHEPEPSSIDRALGVAEKRRYETVVEVDQRKIVVGGTVGLIDGDWRVLFLTAI